MHRVCHLECLPNLNGNIEVMTKPASVISTFGQLSFRRVSVEKSVPSWRDFSPGIPGFEMTKGNSGCYWQIVIDFAAPIESQVQMMSE